MILCNSYKFIFIHPHRTGGTALTVQLKRQHLHALKESSQHDNAKTDESNFIAKNRNYTILGTVRNPWARILSWYLVFNQFDRKTEEEEKKGFEDFLLSGVLDNSEDQYFHYNQLDYFTNKEGDLLCKDFIRFERYAQDVEAVFKKLKVSLKSPALLNTTLGKNHRQFYSKKSEEFVREKCKKDIEYFDYKF